jgi:hypothetical protein
MAVNEEVALLQQTGIPASNTAAAVSGARTLPAFRDAPARYADPALVAALIAPGVRAQTAQNLLSAPRTAARAAALLAAMLPEPGPDDLDPLDARLVTADPVSLDAVTLAAGAVWHGRRVSALLRGADIAALETACGPAARPASLRHAPPSAAIQETADLLADIRRDAASCLAAWVASLPAWAAARIRLGRAVHRAPDHSDIRAALVRTLAPEHLA